MEPEPQHLPKVAPTRAKQDKSQRNAMVLVRKVRLAYSETLLYPPRVLEPRPVPVTLASLVQELPSLLSRDLGQKWWPSPLSQIGS